MLILNIVIPGFVPDVSTARVLANIILAVRRATIVFVILLPKDSMSACRLVLAAAVLPAQPVQTVLARSSVSQTVEHAKIARICARLVHTNSFGNREPRIQFITRKPIQILYFGAKRW